MARFKTLRQKEKRYVFDFLANRGDPNPAAAVFARFPLPDEGFMPKPNGSIYEGIDLEKVAKKDSAETEKFISAFVKYFSANAAKIDYGYFVRECVDRFENFGFEDLDGNKKEIKTVDDFLTLPVEMLTLIADDCYKYAQKRDEFTVGE